MHRLKKEVEDNFIKFDPTWKKRVFEVIKSLDDEDQIFRKSYFRLISLQAWRSELLEVLLPSDALEFYLESQNDAVLSHVFAHTGYWRSALQSLRSCLENVLQCLYYKDHPIEIQLWHLHKHRMQFSELIKYLSTHPQILDIPKNINPIDNLKNEYQTLSLAVHASAKTFRMTSDPDQIVICSNDKASLGSWSTREKFVLSSLNNLLLILFHEHLEGTQRPNLRKAISFTISPRNHSDILEYLKVRLFKHTIK